LNFEKFLNFFLDVFWCKNEEKFQQWHGALNYLINGVAMVSGEPKIKVVNQNQIGILFM
jgi:hypothetical protein